MGTYRTVRRGPARWLIMCAVGLGGAILGIVVGSASAQSSNTPSSTCAAIADDYRALVNEALDAGVSLDDAVITEVIGKRKALDAAAKAAC